MRKDVLESADLESPEGGRKKVVQITGGRQVSDYAGAFSRGVEATAVGEIGGDGTVDVDATLKGKQFRDRIYRAAGKGEAGVDLGAGEDGQRLPEERVDAIVNLDQEVQRLKGRKLTYTGLSPEGADQIQRALGGSSKRAFSKQKSGEVLQEIT